jgi:hypothetical protein
MIRMTFIATVLTVLLVGVGPSHAITVQIFQCTGGFATTCTTQLGTTLGSDAATSVTIGSTTAYGGKLLIASGSVTKAETSTTKNMKMSAVIKGVVAGNYLIRMTSGTNLYGAQPGGTNYPNAVALDGSWIGGTTPRIRAILTANYSNPANAYTTLVDQPTASPTVDVVFNGTLFSRLQNTKSESIYLPSQNLSCLNSAGATINTCGRASHRKDVYISIGLNQTLNMAETAVTVTPANDIQHGGRAQVNQALFCGVTSSQFQFGSTTVERNYVVSPQGSLSSDPDRPNNSPPNVKIQFATALSRLDGTEKLVSIPGDVDSTNNSQFDLFLPCQPVTFGAISNLTAVFPTNAFTVNDSTSDACEGTLRWAVNLVDKFGAPHVVYVLYGDPAQSFNSCSAYSNVNMITVGGARFLVDNDSTLQTRAQVNSFNNYTVTSIAIVLDGTFATLAPFNSPTALDITVTLTTLQVNNDPAIVFASRAEVAVCPPPAPLHGFQIRITQIHPTTHQPTGFESVLTESDGVSTDGCKVSLNADTATEFNGPGVYRIEALNNFTSLFRPGFIALGP